MPRTPINGRRLLGLAGAGAGLLYGLLVFVPWVPLAFDESLDSSWNAVLHLAFDSALQYGRDIIFTFGPFGFMYNPYYYPSTYPVAMAAWVFLAIAFWLAVADIARRSIDHPGLQALWMCGLTAVAGSGVITGATLLAGAGADPFFYSLGALLLVRHFRAGGHRSLPSMLLIIALALASLVKFTFFVLGLFVVSVVSIDEVVRRRRFPVAAPSYAAAVFLLWVLAGQQASGLWSYFRSSLAVSSEYSGAMSLEGPVAEIAFFGATALLFLALVKRAGATDHDGRALHLAGLAGTLFLALKVGYVRHDRHAVIAADTLLVILLVYFPVLWASASDRFRKLQCAAALLAAITLSWSSPYVHFGLHTPPVLSESVFKLGERVTAAARLLGGTDNLNGDFKASMAAVRARNPLPRITLPTDLYSEKQVLVMAYGFPYRPRPVFQSYVAYTPALAEMNAAHLRGAEAPDVVMVEIKAIDERFPALDDSLSWPELLTRYDVAGVAGPTLLMRRAAAPRTFSMVPVGELSAGFDRPLELPAVGQGLLWVRIDIRPTAAGRLAVQLFKASSLLMSVKTRDGGERQYRIVPSMARMGFLLSPLVDSGASFLALAAGTWRSDLAGAQVTSITLRGDPSGVYYEREATVSLFRLELGSVAR